MNIGIISQAAGLLVVLAACDEASSPAVFPEPLVTRIHTADAALPKSGRTKLSSFDETVDRWLEIHVEPASGDDGGDADGSFQQPLKSFSEAMRRVVNQSPPEPTRIKLAAGDYGPLGTVENLQRTMQSPLVISGAVDADGAPLTRVDGGADGMEEAGSNCIRFSNVTYIVIENIHCRNAFPHGINVDDGSDYATPTHHMIIRNWSIGDVGLYRKPEGRNSDCLKLSGVDHFQVLDSEFFNCVQGEFIDMVGCHHGLIAGNHFHDKPGNGIQTKGGSSDILITRNVIARVEDRFIQLGGDTGEAYYRPADAPYPASRIRVVSNLLRDVGNYAGQDDNRSVAFSVNGCSDCLIAHNTVLDIQSQAALVFIDREEADRPGNGDVVLANNLYVMAGRGSHRRSAKNAKEYRVSGRGVESAARLRFENEIVFDPAEPGAERKIDPASALRPDQFVNSGRFDPGIDESGRLLPGSRAVHFGTDAYHAQIPGDFEETDFAHPPAAGAYAARSNLPPD